MRKPEDLKLLGAFYTPRQVAVHLAEWAVRNGAESVLEPSAGDGALVSAALAIGAQRSQAAIPALSVVAVDIDPVAVRALGGIEGNVEGLGGDFLHLEPSQLGLFDVVLANPPFTRNHSLPVVTRNALRKRFDVSGAAGLWVYFALHSMTFLKRGGRMALVVPASAQFSHYGEQLVGRIREQFSDVQLLSLDKNPSWVGKADERGALLLADGFSNGASEAVARSVWNQTLKPVKSSVADKLYAQSLRLGSLSTITIGAVTGRNRLFLMSDDERRNVALSSGYFKPIVSRSRQLAGLRISNTDLRQLARKGAKTLLLHPAKCSADISLYLSQLDADEIDAVSWFRKRDPWWRVDLGPKCDAVLTCMSHLGPRLVLADNGVYCTNTLHRVVFASHVPASVRRAAALTVLSTFGQLMAERLGRPYGGGVLKIEPSGARNLPILLPGRNIGVASMRRLDQLLREGNDIQARALADEITLKPFLGRKWRAALESMEEEIVYHRTRRQRTE
jgi:predicted RNA methylase